MIPCIIIPAYNEAKRIGSLIKELKRKGFDVLVIDDGSSDNTIQIAKASEASVLRNAVNQGKGASLIKGFGHCLAQGFDAVITMDGDGQHLADDIEKFISKADERGAGIVVGNRMCDAKTMPLARVLTNKFMSWLISLITKQDIPDTQCGFRLIKRSVLEKSSLSSTKYEIESEMLIKAASLGFKIESVPIKTVYRGEKSQINPFIDTLRFISFIIKEIWIMPL